MMHQILRVLEGGIVAVLALLLFFFVMSLAIPVALALAIFDALRVIKRWSNQGRQAHVKVDLERVSQERALRALGRNFAKDS